MRVENIQWIRKKPLSQNWLKLSKKRAVFWWYELAETLQTQKPSTSIVVLKLPEVKDEAERPNRCPVCKGVTFQRWSGRRKKVFNHGVKQVRVNRYRCCQCRYTFRHYPDEWIQPSRANDCIGWRP